MPKSRPNRRRPRPKRKTRKRRPQPESVQAPDPVDTWTDDGDIWINYDSEDVTPDDVPGATYRHTKGPRTTYERGNNHAQRRSTEERG